MKIEFTAILNILLMLVIFIFVAYLMFKTAPLPKQSIFKVSVLVQGTTLKLTLNEEQYQQFEDWFRSKDGIFEISDTKNSVRIMREHVSSVIVKFV
jgi:hypothetical protein